MYFTREEEEEISCLDRIVSLGSEYFRFIHQSKNDNIQLPKRPLPPVTKNELLPTSWARCLKAVCLSKKLKAKPVIAGSLLNLSIDIFNQRALILYKIIWTIDKPAPTSTGDCSILSFCSNRRILNQSYFVNETNEMPAFVSLIIKNLVKADWALNF